MRLFGFDWPCVRLLGLDQHYAGSFGENWFCARLFGFTLPCMRLSRLDRPCALPESPKPPLRYSICFFNHIANIDTVIIDGPHARLIWLCQGSIGLARGLFGLDLPCTRPFGLDQPCTRPIALY